MSDTAQTADARTWAAERAREACRRLTGRHAHDEAECERAAPDAVRRAEIHRRDHASDAACPTIFAALLDAMSYGRQGHAAPPADARPALKKGSRIRMTADLKARMWEGSRDHVYEFGECVGVVDGFVDFHNVGDPLDIGKIGPEVNVRWQPSDLRYAYHPSDLEIVP